jgi:hypothetical protein
MILPLSIAPRSHRATHRTVRTPAPITPYPTGRLVWGALSQALRARSPSQTTAHPKPWTCATNRCDRDVGLAESGYDHAVPPGHFAGSSHAATCPWYRANHISDRILHLRGGDSSGLRSREFVPGYHRSPPGALSITGTFRNSHGNRISPPRLLRFSTSLVSSRRAPPYR